MAQRAEQIIIDVEFNVGETEAQLGNVTKRIQELKAANRQLKDDLKKGNGDWAANQAALKQNEAELKSLTAAEKDLAAQLSVASQQRRTYSDSFKGQAAQLADLKNQYSSLSKAERESAGGQEMLKHLTELDKQVKENDKSMGNFQRNVGNYPTVFDLSGTSIGKFQQMLQGLQGNATTAGGVISGAFQGIKSQAMALGKVFLTPPIALIALVLGAIYLAAKKLSEAFKKNDDAGTNLQRGMSALKPIGEAISWVFDKLAVVLGKVALWAGKAFTAIMSLIPGYKAAAKAADDLVVAQDKLEDMEQQYTINSAWRSKEIARLKKEAVNTQKYSNKEIADMLKKADDLELQDLKENKNRLAIKYNNLVKFYKQENDTSDKAKNAKAAALAEYYRADEAYYSATLRLASKANAANERLEQEAAERRKKWQEKRDEMLKNTEEISKRLEDAIIAGKKESVEKEIELEKIRVEREIEALKKETNLTAEGLRERDLLILQLQKNFNQKSDELREKNKEETRQKEIEAEQNRLKLLLEVAEKGSMNEYALRLQVIDNLRRQELEGVEKGSEQERAIKLKYQRQEEDAERQMHQRIFNLKKQSLDNYFNEYKLQLEQQNATAVEFANLELEQAIKQAEALAEVDKSTFETKEAYDAAVIESKRRVLEATKAVQAAEQAQFESQVAMLHGFGDAISNVLSEVAADSKDAVVFQKLIALAKVSLSLAESIAAATAASTAGDPYTMAARIVANVASVVTAFSQVTKAIKATNVPSAPKFAGGGIVPGSATVGDNVIVRVNSGEMIFNAEQQKRLFDMIAKNRLSGGSSFDYEMLAMAISRMPAPKLIMKEFNDYQGKIVTFDEQIKI